MIVFLVTVGDDDVDGDDGDDDAAADDDDDDDDDGHDVDVNGGQVSTTLYIKTPDCPPQRLLLV